MEQVKLSDVARLLGVTPEALKKHVRNIWPNKMENGKATYLNENEITEIKSKMTPTTKVAAVSTDTEMMQKAHDVMMWMNSKVQELQQDKKQLQIDLDKEKAWYSVKRVKNLGLLPNMTANEIWRPLKKWCIENDMRILSIFDANYGEVKTYHADAWNAVYGLDLYYGVKGTGDNN